MGDQRISIQQLQMFLNEYEETPYAALNYTAGQCNYGGRVTDDHDRRVLIAYFAPPLGTVDSIVEYITSLPIMQPPEIFGLHDNANLTKDQNETTGLFTDIIATRTGGGGGGGFDEVLVNNIANDILAKLPPDFDQELAGNKYPTDPMESMNTVLKQELIRFVKLTSTMRSSLKQLQLAMKGLVVMSAELDAVAMSLSVGVV